MSEQGAERKEFPASRRKLTKMRERGQFAQSKDVTATFSTMCGTAYVYFVAYIVAEHLEGLFDLIFMRIQEPQTHQIFEVISLGVYELVLLSLPAFILTAVIAALSTGLMGQGLSFSAESIAPKFERINPAEGFKRLFGKEGLFNFVTSLAKVAVFLTALFLFIRYFWTDLVFLPAKHITGLEVVFGLLLLLSGLMLSISLTISGIDYLIQRSLFMENAKMTRKEMKDERREMEGDDRQKARRKEIARENLQRPAAIKLTTFTLEHGRIVLAFRFVEGKTPVPILMGKATSREGCEAIRQSLPRRLIRIRHPLAAKLRKTKIGFSVGQNEVGDLARLMREHGVYS